MSCALNPRPGGEGAGHGATQLSCLNPKLKSCAVVQVLHQLDSLQDSPNPIRLTLSNAHYHNIWDTSLLFGATTPSAQQIQRVSVIRAQVAGSRIRSKTPAARAPLIPILASTAADNRCGRLSLDHVTPTISSWNCPYQQHSAAPRFLTEYRVACGLTLMYNLVI